MARDSTEKYEHYNVQALLVSNLAERIFFTEDRLSRAYEGKPRYFREAKSWVTSLKNKIKALALIYSDKQMKIISLNIKIAEKLSQNNQYEEATDFLWRAFEVIQNVFKANNLMFPRKAKGMSFKDFATSEIK